MNCLSGTGHGQAATEAERTRLRLWIQGCLGRGVAAYLSLFRPGDLELVNTSLPQAPAVLKCALAMRELPRLGIPTARVLGTAVLGCCAGLLSEGINLKAWSTHTV